MGENHGSGCARSSQESRDSAVFTILRVGDIANVIENYYHSHDTLTSNPAFRSQPIQGATMSTNSAINAASPAGQTLAALKKGEAATVVGLAGVDGAEQLAIQTRLFELGFVPGERVRVVAESFPRRDPMAVRLGNTTFALRRHEATLIRIERC
jgi:ferrous iron transport protein A